MMLKPTLSCYAAAMLTRASVVTACLFAVSSLASAQTLSPAPATSPLATLHGKGFQVYRCEAGSWILDHPDADLLSGKKVVGHHDAGPSWHDKDGSSVTGKATEKQASPEPNAVPWLTVQAVSHAGSGLFTQVALIRRTETHGGVAPSGGCDASHEGASTRVPYTATYTFYGQQ